MGAARYRAKRVGAAQRARGAPRFAALTLLIMTLLMQFYVMPAMWWPAHVYWASILLVLMSVGPGAVSIDALIRYIYERDRSPAFR